MTDRNLLRAQLLIEAADLLDESIGSKDIKSFKEAISKLDYKNVTKKDYDALIFPALGLGITGIRLAKTKEDMIEPYNLVGSLPPFFMPQVLKNVEGKEKILLELRKNYDGIEKMISKYGNKNDEMSIEKAKQLNYLLNSFGKQLLKNSK